MAMSNRGSRWVSVADFSPEVGLWPKHVKRHLRAAGIEIFKLRSPASGQQLDAIRRDDADRFLVRWREMNYAGRDSR